MNKALSASLVLLMTAGLLLGGCSSVSSAQAPSGPADRVLDQHKTPDGRSDVFLYCRNGDFYVYMDGVRSGSIQMIPEMKDRCNK